MKYTVRPISDRTAFTGNPVPSRFTVLWSDCCELLERELSHLDARDLVIECDVREQDIRLDGMLRANARATSPAVRLAFESNVGPLTYATDAFVRPSWRRGGMTEHWQHNVYAIAKSLEALRMVDRYGVTKRGEQYAGFKALPAGRAMPASDMTASAARGIIHAQAIRRVGPDSARTMKPSELVKHALRAAHPDHNGGDHALWDQVEQAAKVLGLRS